MLFQDRQAAGRALAQELSKLQLKAPVVLALPRGGVPIGFEVALALDAPLDIVLVRKIGAPGQPELALGAVVDGEHPEIVLNEDVKGTFDTADSYVEERSRIELKEIERRRALYLEGRPPVPLKGRTAIVVDDGIATGATMRAALRAVRRRGPELVVLAVPVAPQDSIALLRQEVDRTVCLSTPLGFAGVGQFYVLFPQVNDATVVHLLRARASALNGDGGRTPQAAVDAPR